MKNKMSIYAIKLYKFADIQWVFDDPSKGIVAEAFVGGADTLIDNIIEMKFGEDERMWLEGYVMRFSANDFPGSHCIEHLPIEGLKQLKENNIEIIDNGSYWLYNGGAAKNDDGDVLWLCDTLDEYFGIDDKLLFFDIVKVKNYI